MRTARMGPSLIYSFPRCQWRCLDQLLCTPATSQLQSNMRAKLNWSVKFEGVHAAISRWPVVFQSTRSPVRYFGSFQRIMNGPNSSKWSAFCYASCRAVTHRRLWGYKVGRSREIRLTVDLVLLGTQSRICCRRNLE